MWIPMDETESYRIVVVACNNEGCNGKITHESWLGDFSPRLDDECPKCKKYYCVKLKSIEEERIISRGVVSK